MTTASSPVASKGPIIGCVTMREIVTLASAKIEPWGPIIRAEVILIARAYVRWQRKVRAAANANSRRRLKERQARALASHACRMCAVIINHKGPKRPLSFFDIRADEVNCRRASGEPVHVIGIPKADGSIRPITIFGGIEASKQFLLREVLTASWGHSPYEFSRRGRGRETAIRHTLHAIKVGELHTVVEADIKDFFPSVNTGALAKALRIPASIVENTVKIGKTNAIYIHNIHLSTIAVRRGLPMGSRSSPFIAAKVLEPSFKSLTVPMTCCYIDNVLLASRGREDASGAIDALAVSLKENPAGPFVFKYAHVGGLKEDNDYLGYWIRHNKPAFGGGARATPSKRSITKAQRKLVPLLALSSSAKREEFLDRWAQTWADQMPEWRYRHSGTACTQAFISALEWIVPFATRLSRTLKARTFDSFVALDTIAKREAQKLAPDPWYKPYKNWGSADA